MQQTPAIIAGMHMGSDCRPKEEQAAGSWSTTWSLGAVTAGDNEPCQGLLTPAISSRACGGAQGAGLAYTGPDTPTKGCTDTRTGRTGSLMRGLIAFPHRGRGLGTQDCAHQLSGLTLDDGTAGSSQVHLGTKSGFVMPLGPYYSMGLARTGKPIQTNPA